jgi:hypothetical protein
MTEIPTLSAEDGTVVADVVTDNPWQRTARRIQSSWRERSSLRAGPWPGRRNVLLGSRLTAEDAAAGRNFLTPFARADAEAVIAAAETQARLLPEPRMRENLLSSQPLCFNLFAELRHDLPLATAALGQLWPKIDAVTEIDYDWNPHRRDLAYTGTDTAFDVAVAYHHRDGSSGLLGFKVAYQEDLSGTSHEVSAPDTYARLAALSASRLGIANPRSAGLTASPLWQLWLPHLLAESYAERGDVGHATFVFVHPRGNDSCAVAWSRYAHVVPHGERQVLTLETLVDTVASHTDAPWIDAVRSRYLPDPGEH